MVVKGERGRRRYILFDTVTEYSKESLIRELRRVCPADTPYVIQVTANFAIVRCGPKEREMTIETMSKAVPGCHSVTTSGTLITIRKKFPVLKVSRARA